MSKSEIETKAKEAAIVFMEQEENINFVPQEVEFTTAIGGGTVWVYGYNEKDSSVDYSVTVDYDDNTFSVSGLGEGETIEYNNEQNKPLISQIREKGKVLNFPFYYY